MGRPVRKLRRFIKRTYDKGKGFKGKHKGKGKARHAFLAEMTDADVDQAFFGGKGKSGKNRSSGKGKGRKKKPHWSRRRENALLHMQFGRAFPCRVPPQ